MDRHTVWAWALGGFLLGYVLGDLLGTWHGYAMGLQGLVRSWSLFLMADSAPVTVQCASACTVTHVITIDVPPFNLTEEQGAQISGAVLLVWAVGWGLRTVIRSLREVDGNSSSED